MSAQWISRDELKKLTGWSDRHVTRQVSCGELQSRETETSGKNGRPLREFFLGSLSAELQEKYMRQRIAEASATVLVPTSDNGQGLLFDPRRGERLIVTDEQLQEATEREKIIRPMLDFSGPGTFDALAARIAGEQEVSKPTIWRWYSSYKKHGFSALSDRIRADKGFHRFFHDHQEAARFVQAKYLSERLSIQLTHEALCREWKHFYNGDSKPPSYSTVRSYLQSLPKAVSTLAREGERAFDEKCAPFLIRKIEAVTPNQVWVSDHCKHDVWVRNDGFFPGIDRDQALRPWLTAILDMRSRKIVGWVWNATPSSHTISSAIHNAVIESGIPTTFYIDNGKDYEKVGKIDLSEQCSGVLSRLGIAPQYCLPKHPQSKLIESWFATLHKRFDTIWHPFYCGTSPATRPEVCDAALAEHKRWLDGKAKTSPLPSAREFCQLAEAWIRDEYNSQYRAHSGQGMDGATPDEVFARELPESARRTVDAPKALYELLWDRQHRRVMEGGSIQIYNQRYEGSDAASDAAMLALIGRDVAIACDPLNLGEAIAVNEHGDVIARLQAQKLVEHGPVSHDDIRASMRKRRVLKRAIRDYVDGIAIHVPSEVEMMRERHAVAASVRPQRRDVIAISGGALPRLPGAAIGYDSMVQHFLEEE